MPQHTKLLEIHHRATRNETRTLIPTIRQIRYDGVHSLLPPPLLRCLILQCVPSRNGTPHHQLKKQRLVECERALCQVGVFVEDQ